MGYYKIGISTDPIKRFKDISNLVPIDLELIFYAEHKRSSSMESTLHFKFREYSIRQEWFRLNHEHALEAVMNVMHRVVKDKINDDQKLFISDKWYRNILAKQSDDWYTGPIHDFILRHMEVAYNG